MSGIGEVKRDPHWWDMFFMAEAELNARASKDPQRQVGALLVSPDKRRKFSGYNGFPAGMPDLKRWLTHGAFKNEFMIHAEVNAILNAKTDLAGFTLYSTYHPCLPCALVIAQAEIARVVCPASEAGTSWGESHRKAVDLFSRTGVRLAYVDTKGGCEA